MPNLDVQTDEYVTAPRVYLGLGSNLGDRNANLEEAIRLLGELGAIAARSHIRETEPWGVTDQPDYLNMVIALDTELPLGDLHQATKSIEVRIGREPGPKWGPRLIDIDILLYGDVQVETPKLTVPHPLMAERDFVMVPLAEIAPDVAEAVRRKGKRRDDGDVSL